jgi:hypothetical protein
MNAHDRLKPVLEFVAIQRHDTKQWALPGVRELLSRVLIHPLIFFLRVWLIQAKTSAKQSNANFAKKPHPMVLMKLA